MSKQYKLNLTLTANHLRSEQACQTSKQIALLLQLRFAKKIQNCYICIKKPWGGFPKIVWHNVLPYSWIWLTHINLVLKFNEQRCAKPPPRLDAYLLVPTWCSKEPSQKRGQNTRGSLSLNSCQMQPSSRAYHYLTRPSHSACKDFYSPLQLNTLWQLDFVFNFYVFIMFF